MRFASRLFFVSFTLLLVLVASAATSTAVPITISGTTQGGFDAGPLSTHPILVGTFLGHPATALEFQGQPFSINAQQDGTPNVVAVGSFDLRTFSNFNFNGHTFSLEVTFTAPSVGGGNPATFVANLTGTISANELFDGSEKINIDFDNTPQVFSYAGGYFTFAVQDLLQLNEQSGFVNLNAVITAQTPEPMTVALFGSGLAGVGWKLRKRKSTTSR